jgi:hypothetical protein
LAQLCENILDYKVGVIAGSAVFDHKTNPKRRVKICEELNDRKSQLKGVVMTPGTGGVGLNMPGASVMLFMGSMYSLENEAQAVCESHPLN